VNFGPSKLQTNFVEKRYAAVTYPSEDRDPNGCTFCANYGSAVPPTVAGCPTNPVFKVAKITSVPNGAPVASPCHAVVDAAISGTLAGIDVDSWSAELLQVVYSAENSCDLLYYKEFTVNAEELEDGTIVGEFSDGVFTSLDDFPNFVSVAIGGTVVSVPMTLHYTTSNGCPDYANPLCSAAGSPYPSSYDNFAMRDCSDGSLDVVLLPSGQNVTLFTSPKYQGVAPLHNTSATNGLLQVPDGPLFWIKRNVVDTRSCLTVSCVAAKRAARVLAVVQEQGQEIAGINSLLHSLIDQDRQYQYAEFARVSEISDNVNILNDETRAQFSQLSDDIQTSLVGIWDYAVLLRLNTSLHESSFDSRISYLESRVTELAAVANIPGLNFWTFDDENFHHLIVPTGTGFSTVYEYANETVQVDFGVNCSVAGGLMIHPPIFIGDLTFTVKNSNPLVLKLGSPPVSNVDHVVFGGRVCDSTGSWRTLTKFEHPAGFTMFSFPDPIVAPSGVYGGEPLLQVTEAAAAARAATDRFPAIEQRSAVLGDAIASTNEKAAVLMKSLNEDIHSDGPLGALDDVVEAVVDTVDDVVLGAGDIAGHISKDFNIVHVVGILLLVLAGCFVLVFIAKRKIVKQGSRLSRIFGVSPVSPEAQIAAAAALINPFDLDVLIKYARSLNGDAGANYAAAVFKPKNVRINLSTSAESSA